MHSCFHRFGLARQVAAALLPLVSFAAAVRGDIFQWEYVNPADPSQGKRQSATLAPDGAGVNAVPGADLAYRDLSNAYLIGATLGPVLQSNFPNLSLTPSNLFGTILTNADLSLAYLSHANLSNATLTDANLRGANLLDANADEATLTRADFTDAEVRGANFSKYFGYGSGLSLGQLYATRSYQLRDLTGINFVFNNLAGANLAYQNLTNVNFSGAVLADADFTNAEIRGANFSYQIHASPGAGGQGEFWTPPPIGTAIALPQLYSTASYREKNLGGIGLANNNLAGGNFAGQNLSGADFGYADLTGANFRQANLTNARFFYLIGENCSSLLCLPIFAAAKLDDADLSAADTRGSELGPPVLSAASTTNMVWPDGHINGLDLVGDDLLIIRDHDGNPNGVNPWNGTPAPAPPISITVNEHLAMAPGGALRMAFEADAWDSTISFAPGIPVTLGGTLELAFADDVNAATQLGRTIDLFDWTGVTPAGAFVVSSPHRWDLSNLYTTGEVTLIAVPEPSRSTILAACMCALISYRRRQIP